MVEKNIDNLGRVVIPKKFRDILGIEANEKLLVSLDKERIIISPIDARCALCKSKVGREVKLRLCRSCIQKVKVIE